MRYALPALPVILAALFLLAWCAERHRKATYHRHRYTHARSHARPTLAHRVRLAMRRLASVRIHITTTARTAC
jgi:hypothetical protein